MSIPEFTPHYSRHSTDAVINYINKEKSIAEVKRMLLLPARQLLKAKFFLSKCTRKLMGVLFGTLEPHELPKVPLPPMPYYHLIEDLIDKA